MKHVVITGSTRGIGYGLAREFLGAGCRVMINGQSQESVNTALQSLREMYHNIVEGYAATVHKRDELEQLWNDAAKQFGTIDIWINNAGIDQERKYFWELDEEAYDKVIRINLKVGTLSPGMVATDFLRKSLD